MALAQTKKPVSKIKVAVMWAIFLGFTLCVFAFLLWAHKEQPARTEPDSEPLHGVVNVILGGFFLVAGVVAYAVLLASNCFTFNFQHPVWAETKAKLYFANIVVLTAFGLGLGFGISPLIGPALSRSGVSGEVALLGPVMGALVVLQIARVFVLIWAPVERRLIRKRLQARGITAAQLDAAMLVGISDPTRSSFKKFASVEDDLGALWIGPEQLVYWGDTQQFGVTREQLVQSERKADTGGTSMLGGLTHLILHVRKPEGSEQQIRLHTEGHWTMAAKRRAMDQLDAGIAKWHGSAVQSPPPLPANMGEPL
ncbi:MAG TPA: hypothetical protein VN578_20280 [Candidatus Binatia bacterium]|jgi:hypothetical protein|nr:hypothetical protein [Candidatus Binatia bacterium]